VLAHRDNVLTTLGQLNIREGLVKNMISIGNKLDNVTDQQMEVLLKSQIISAPKEEHAGSKIASESLTPVSCRTNEGLPELLQRIDQVTIKKFVGGKYFGKIGRNSGKIAIFPLQILFFPQ
jgi:50S ribosomal subunit-associated GTPase HflX